MATLTRGRHNTMVVSFKRPLWSTSTLITLAFGLSVLLKIAATIGLRRANAARSLKVEREYSE